MVQPWEKSTIDLVYNTFRLKLFYNNGFFPKEIKALESRDTVLN